MNFQAKPLMDLVGYKNPTKRYRTFIVRLLNCLRDKKATEALANKEKEYLLNQIKERDVMIETLIRKNVALMDWKRQHEENSYSKVRFLA